MAELTGLGNLTIRDLGRQRKVYFHRGMTTKDYVAAWKKFGPIIIALFPIIATILAVLDTLETLLNTAIQIYQTLKTELALLKKRILIAAGILTGNPMGVQEANKEAKKQVVKQAREAVETAYKQLETKILDTPIKDIVAIA